MDREGNRTMGFFKPQRGVMYMYMFRTYWNRVFPDDMVDWWQPHRSLLRSLQMIEFLRADYKNIRFSSQSTPPSIHCPICRVPHEQCVDCKIVDCSTCNDWYTKSLAYRCDRCHATATAAETRAESIGPMSAADVRRGIIGAVSKWAPARLAQYDTNVQTNPRKRKVSAEAPPKASSSPVIRGSVGEAKVSAKPPPKRKLVPKPPPTPPKSTQLLRPKAKPKAMPGPIMPKARPLRRPDTSQPSSSKQSAPPPPWRQ